MSVIVIMPPAAILDAATIRAGLGLGSTPADAVLLALGAAAQGMIDGPRGTLKRAIGPQTLEYRLDSWSDRHHRQVRDFDADRWHAKLSGPDWPCGYQGIWLPFPPVTSVTSVTYVDVNGASQTLDPSTYALVGGGEDVSRIVPTYGTTWPKAEYNPEAIKVQYVAGYASIPPALIIAMQLLVRNLYTVTSRDATLRSETVFGMSSQSFETSAAAGQAMDRAVEALIGPYRVLEP
jgi:hypothetical protein